MIRVPFLDLAASQAPLTAELDEAWQRVTRSARYVGGPVVEEFEDAWAGASGVGHAVGVGNGTDAIELALRGLGLGPGDEVLVPANTFIATAEAVVAVGAVPRFIDVDPATMLVTPEAVEAGTTPRTAAVIVVHLYGQAADMTAIADVARRTGIAVVEDCAQAQGARWNGRPVGSFGVAGCTSFYPGKNLGAFGDGGALVTDDAALARRVRQLADHGRALDSKYEHPLVGRNSRLDAVQAAVLSVKLPHLGSWNEQRRSASRQYAERLSGFSGVRLTEQSPGSESVHHLEVVRVPGRDEVRAALLAAGIETGIHYPVPCHRQAGYLQFPHQDLQVTEGSSPHLLSLPLFPGITGQQVDLVCDELLRALEHQTATVGTHRP
ncbi:DegT/DnrJ/EryC1/StrS family aminotransferase [Kineococcus esterisolvens]|uniref:DegT/DnrJ/EryC1/StrS family aminotransferase n=1 Tax=unclassified Kineococcus TaxID=2621656 RepID=UPI003D7C815F